MQIIDLIFFNDFLLLVFVVVGGGGCDGVVAVVVSLGVSEWGKLLLRFAHASTPFYRFRLSLLPFKFNVQGMMLGFLKIALN